MPQVDLSPQAQVPRPMTDSETPPPGSRIGGSRLGTVSLALRMVALIPQAPRPVAAFRSPARYANLAASTPTRGETMLRPRLRFGIFMAPFHPTSENPTLCLERDRELIQWLDQLGFDEAWIGEHHSAGYEIIASPELFIADVAARTRHIRLGTGVVSLPYHHPLMVADRITQL